MNKYEGLLMASDRQIEANRRNAQKSTGPRTIAGKARVSKNAMKHGLTAAQHLVFADEDPGEFVAFEDAIFDELDPRTALEGACVRRIVGLHWRLRRVPEFEAAIMWRFDFKRRDQMKKLPHHYADDLEPETDEEARRVWMGDIVRDLLISGLDEKLARYESRLLAQLHKSYDELRQLQAAREDETETAIVTGPMITDVEAKV
jgi:hypothetical protein